MRPLAIDLYCGLGGWTEGLLAEGYDVVGFDIERHVYGEHHYPAQLVLQDVRTLDGSQFKDAALIVASSPCQEYSYMAMPWSRAKEKARWYRDPAFPERLDALNELFNQPARIQREACEAAGRFIPMVQENVLGAVKWVGRYKWRYGSYCLWGDVPALMPVTTRRTEMKVGDVGWRREPGQQSVAFTGTAVKRLRESADSGVKVPGMNWSGSDKPGYKAVAFNDSAIKNGGDWFGSGDDCSAQRRAGSKSSARKAASARIAKIPLPLAQWIAHCYLPRRTEAA